MLLSLARIRWWGEKNPTEEKITAVSWWRNCFNIPIPGGDHQLTMSEWILTVGYSWCHCTAFLTVSFVCSSLLDFCWLSRIYVGHASVQGRIIRTLLGYFDRTKCWFCCPAVWFMMTHESFVSSMGSWMSLDVPTPSWLRISIQFSRPSIPSVFRHRFRPGESTGSQAWGFAPEEWLEIADPIQLVAS